MTAFSNSRRNPLSPTAISWRTMDLEVHTIEEFDELPGIYGIELQDRPNPNVTNVYFTDTGWMTGDGVTGLTELTLITSGNPAAGQFRIGGGLSSKLIMNVADDTKQVVVEYEGGGTTFSLQTIIAIVQDLIGTITDTFDRIFANFIQARTSAGLDLEATGGTLVANFGAGGGNNATFEGGVNHKGAISAGSGSESNPDIHNQTDTNTGIWFNASDEMSFVTGGATRLRVLPTGQLQAVYESTVGTDYNTTLHNMYPSRAWVNFNGTGTVAIRASGNISSITDNGTGDYTANFTTAMPDADYGVTLSGGVNSSLRQAFTQYGMDGAGNIVTPTTTSVRVIFISSAGAMTDTASYTLGVFR